MTRRTAAGVVCVGIFAADAAAQQSGAKEEASMLQVYQELFDFSMKEKKGLTFYINGQTVGGGVVKIHGDTHVEVRNQMSPRILIRIDRIDAIQVG